MQIVKPTEDKNDRSRAVETNSESRSCSSSSRCIGNLVEPLLATATEVTFHFFFFMHMLCIHACMRSAGWLLRCTYYPRNSKVQCSSTDHTSEASKSGKGNRFISHSANAAIHLLARSLARSSKTTLLLLPRSFSC